MRKPNHSEWDTTRLPGDRRAYLDAGLSFEEIAARILTEAQIVDALIEGYGNSLATKTRDELFSHPRQQGSLRPVLQCSGRHTRPLLAKPRSWIARNPVSDRHPIVQAHLIF